MAKMKLRKIMMISLVFRPPKFQTSFLWDVCGKSHFSIEPLRKTESTATINTEAMGAQATLVSGNSACRAVASPVAKGLAEICEPWICRKLLHRSCSQWSLWYNCNSSVEWIWASWPFRHPWISLSTPCLDVYIIIVSPLVGFFDTMSLPRSCNSCFVMLSHHLPYQNFKFDGATHHSTLCKCWFWIVWAHFSVLQRVVLYSSCRLRSSLRITSPLRGAAVKYAQLIPSQTWYKTKSGRWRLGPTVWWSTPMTWIWILLQGPHQLSNP